MVKRTYTAFWLFYLLNFVNSTSIDDIYSKFHQNDYRIKFERGDISFVNKSLAKVSLKCFALNRTIKATNLSFVIFNEYGKNAMKVVAQVYKFLSNEYRDFPIELQLDLCKSLDENLMGIKSAFNCGNMTVCPFKKNTKYFTCNNLINEARYPPLIPSGRYKIEMNITVMQGILFTGNSYVTVYRELKPGQRG